MSSKSEEKKVSVCVVVAQALQRYEGSGSVVSWLPVVGGWLAGPAALNLAREDVKAPSY